MTLSPLITEGAQRMLQTDPHGWVLTLIAVLVVFTCLLILFLFYSLSGAVLSGKHRRPSRSDAAPDPSDDSETAAAIALALSLSEAESGHGEQSGRITIKRTPGGSAWADRSLGFRKRPSMKN